MGRTLTILGILERCWRFECWRRYRVHRDFEQRSAVTGNTIIKAGWIVTWSPYHNSMVVKRNDHDSGAHHTCDRLKFQKFVEAGVFEPIPE